MFTSGTIVTVLLILAAVCAVSLAGDASPAVVVSVGPDNADVNGADSLALQKAADLLLQRAPNGGGLLLIKAGTYTMYDSLHIRGPMTVRGEGEKTILRKCPQFKTRLLQDFDLSEYVTRVVDPAGLRVGMGVTFKDKNQTWGWNPCVRTIVAIDGQNVRLDRRPERDYSFAAEAWLQNSFPIISACNVENVILEDLVADGNLDQNRDNNLDGCRAGAIYFHHAKRCTIRRCTGRNFNGDGISWQTTEDILAEDCQACGNTGLGFHPGTGSPRTTIRNCHAHHNGSIGLFLCWGVRFGRFENNILEDNGNFGISIGHKDTDNLFLNNQVRRNGVAGVIFRDEIESTAGHRCTFRNNTIEDNGKPDKPGVGVRIDGETHDTTLEANTIRDTRSGRRTQDIAVQVGPKATNVKIAPDNRIEGEIKR